MAYVNGVWVAEPGQETDPYYDREPPPPSTTDPLDIDNPGGTDPVVPDPDTGESQLDTTAPPVAAGYQAPTIPTAYKATPGENYMTDETSVVGQLGRILDENGEYIQRARAGAAGQANRAGALGSSMGAGAGQGAAIDRGGELAVKEAEIASTFKRGEQQADAALKQVGWEGVVSGELNEQEAKINERQGNINQLFEAGQNNLDREMQQTLQAQNEEANKLMYEFQAQAQKDLTEWETNTTIAAGVKENVRAQVNTLVQNHQIAVESIMSNAELLSTLGNKLPAMLNNLRQSTIAGMTFAVKGTPLAGSLAQYVATLEDDWTFGAGAAI